MGCRMAEEVGFEPTVDFHLRRFSRPVHSTTLPLLRRSPFSGSFPIRKARSHFVEFRRQNKREPFKTSRRALSFYRAVLGARVVLSDDVHHKGVEQQRI